MKRYDAIVVGAGPAGSATSALLAKKGLSVLLLDKAAFPRDKACGEYTSADTEEVLSRIGALKAVEDAGARRLSAMRVISPAGHGFSMEYNAPQVLATQRRSLDAALVAYALQCGAEVRERSRVESVVVTEGHVHGVTLRTRSGTIQEESRLVIGADGVHSAVVRSLGLAAPLRWPQNLGMVAHYRGYSGLDNWGEMHVSRYGYAGLAPQSGGLLNVGLVMPMKSARAVGEVSSVERFERFANLFPGVSERLCDAERVSQVRGVGPIGARVKRVYGHGYLLVGDAAGFFDPFTGEGVYKALRGAELASTVAWQALEENDVSARALSSYAHLRHKAFFEKEIVCRLVQSFVGMPRLMDYVVTRLNRRVAARQVITSVLGDLSDARAALTPSYLWQLLRP
ncbi:MAG: NAD(P)/FAD-dependent oxidoreductase [Chloroflexota bacterium]|nr:NAD(P)/FAD-dependent oxidoreductase [Chloroflexota bacterium]